MNECIVNGKSTNATYGSKVKNMLIDNTKKEIPEIVEEMVDNFTFLNTGLKSKLIKEFYIHNNGTTVPNGYQSIDCSYNQDESVMCYWKEYSNDAGYYEMNIAANGEIYTPFDARYLFLVFGYDKLKNLDLTGINTKYSKVMAAMFNRTGYTAMTSLNLGDKFDTSNVLNMYNMFFHTGHTSMTTLDLGENFDTSKVENMHGMFFGTGYTAMKALNLGSKFDTRNVKNMMEMFGSTGYTSMTTLDLGDKFDTSNVLNMYGMFFQTGYTSMTTLDLGEKFDTSNVENMYAMFAETGKTSMTTLNLGSEFIIPNGTNTQYMFWGCGTSGKLTSVIVPTQAIKTKILGLGNNNVPSWWNTNNIVTVQSN